MEATLSPRPSTLPPPPLETAASGTRTMQRFDVARARQKKREEEPLPTEIEIIVTTVKMAVPESVRQLPLLDGYAPSPAPPAPAPLAHDGVISLQDALWALGASFSLVGIVSVASAAVYLFVFP